MTIVEQINALLPQTQCRECGFSGCLPYAEALVRDNAPVNLCSAGGEVVMQDIAYLLRREPRQPEKIQIKQLAWIDEDACIGCTACIRACPVDAIMGASKLMHTVIADECTGCGLCVAPCPVDCIIMQPIDVAFLPMARSLSQVGQSKRFAAATHAQGRYENRLQRKKRDDMERKQKIAAQQTIYAKQPENQSTFNPADLIARAMAKAQAQQQQLVVTNNHEAFRETQLQAAQEKATYRRYMRDVQYGSEREKAVAIEWLKKYKEEQVAKELANSK